jgi:HlyD family secretion protein
MTTRRLRSWLLFAGVLILAISLAAAIIASRSVSSPVASVPSNPADDGIACLGRISPDGDVIRVSARSISGQPSLVAELLVKEGETVKRGQVVAVLNSREQLDAAWRAAVARLKVAERRLAQVKAGVKPADLAAQQAEIRRLESELATAQNDFRRFQSLQSAAVISAAEFDAKKLTVDATTQQLQQARERLNSLAEIRTVDVDLAQAEVDSATMSVRLARTEYEQSEIRAPSDGRVVEIHTWPGEEINPNGILELAKITPMYVVAEVSQRDIARVRPGQQATITSEALGAPLSGIVERIGSKVAKNDVLHIDPAAMSDARVVETWIRLTASEKAAGLIHAEVSVRIIP